MTVLMKMFRLWGKAGANTLEYKVPGKVPYFRLPYLTLTRFPPIRCFKVGVTITMPFCLSAFLPFCLSAFLPSAFTA